MNTFNLSAFYFILIWILNQSVLGLTQRSRSQVVRQCETPTLKNGSVRVRQRGKFVRYACFSTFILHGDRYAGCVNGRWDSPVPICAKTGCSIINAPENGYVQRELGYTMLFCEPRYVVAGSRYTYCDGLKWDRALGTCRDISIGPEKWCDFETDTMCNWTPDLTHDFEWKRQHGIDSNTQFRSGPTHDHTTMKSLNGYYMVAESSNQMYGEAARLISPLYPAKYSIDSCFRFYYHMYGLTTGQLRIYIKPKSVTMELVITLPQYKYFEKIGSQKNLWHEGTFYIDNQDEEFQIVIEAISGRTGFSNIAIDDVALVNDTECISEKMMTTKQMEEETHAIFKIDSCVNRCNELLPSTLFEEVITNGTGKGGIFLHCNCYDGCEEQNTCCLDYKSACVFGSTTDSVSETVNFTESNENVLNNTFATFELQLNSTTSTTSIIQPIKTTLITTTPTTTSTPTLIITSSSTTLSSTIKSTLAKTTTTRPTTLSTSTQTTTLSTSTPFKITNSSIGLVTKQLKVTTTPPPPISRVNLSKLNISTTSSISWINKMAFLSTNPTNEQPKIIKFQPITTTTTIKIAPTIKTFRITNQLPIIYTIEKEKTTEQTLIDKQQLNVIESDAENGQNYTSLNDSNSTSLLWLLLLILVVIGIISCYVIYRKFYYNPMNYKKNYSNRNRRFKFCRNSEGLLHHNESYNEIRYLTADEQLDFNVQNGTDDNYDK